MCVLCRGWEWGVKCKEGFRGWGVWREAMQSDGANVCMAYDPHDVHLIVWLLLISRNQAFGNTLFFKCQTS